MYPLLFNNILMEKVWGGRDLENILKIKLPDNKKYGESWEISDRDENCSIIQNGEFTGLSLHNLIERYGDIILGDEITSKYSYTFPLLIKHLDITDKLSIQVHPDNVQASKEGFPFGKFESWYVINASEDAQIIGGIKNGISKLQINENIPEENLHDYYNIIPVRTGDFMNIEPGTVHATFSGNILACEIQQNCDLTYRIFDYNREYNGKKRELHLNKGIKVIDEKKLITIQHTKNRMTSIFNGALIEHLTENEFYTIDKLQINGEFNDPLHLNFKVFSALTGNGIIKSSGKDYRISAGMTYLIPAKVKTLVCGNIEILKTYI